MSGIAEVAEGWEGVELPAASAMDADAVLHRLGSSKSGLTREEAARRLAAIGPNAVLSHGPRALQVLRRQLRNPLLILLAGAAIVSVLVGERADAGIILVIVCLSVGLGFVNEYRSEKAVEELHSSIRHTAVTTRGGRVSAVDVTELVPGDAMGLDVGEVVPADLRLLEANASSATNRRSRANLGLPLEHLRVEEATFWGRSGRGNELQDDHILIDRATGETGGVSACRVPPLHRRRHEVSVVVAPGGFR